MSRIPMADKPDPVREQRDSYKRWFEEMTAQRDDLLAALERARFILESPAVAHLVNGAGTLDLVCTAIAKARGQS